MPFLLSPHELGSLVAETMFRVGHIQCGTASSVRGPALFRLLRSLRKVLFSEEVAQFTLFRGGASLKVKMPVKRSLNLDGLLEANSFDPSEITRKKSIINYSPRTGTCQMSPVASPTRSKEQVLKNGPSNVPRPEIEPRPQRRQRQRRSPKPLHHQGTPGKKRKKLNHLNLTKRKESTTEVDEFMVLLSKVEKSSEEIMEIMQSLSSTIQALEGSRELENLIGISYTSCFLKREMQKTKELMMKVTKQKLFEKKRSGLPNKELHQLDSYEFLKAILN